MEGENDLELMMEISNFIEKHGIKSIREYQKYKKEFPENVPGIWFIQERFGSWEYLLIRMGSKTYNRYRWNQYDDDELILIVKNFVKENAVYSQRKYEKVCGKNGLPSLSTLKKRLNNVSYLFSKPKSDYEISDFELLTRLKNEIVRLEMQVSLSMTEFRKKYDRSLLPSVDTIIRKTNKPWEKLMEEIGFDYRGIKLKKTNEEFPLVTPLVGQKDKIEIKSE